MQDVRIAAGFNSLRQFNDVIRSVYARSPTWMRRAARDRPRPPEVWGRITVRLRTRTPFDGQGLLHDLGACAVDGVEWVGPTQYARTLRLPGGPATVRLRFEADHVDCAVRLHDLADLGAAVARMRALLDLDADPDAVDHVLRADPRLAPAVTANPGIRLLGSTDGTETLVRALVEHSDTTSSPQEKMNRLVSAAGEKLSEPDGELTMLFPTATVISRHGWNFVPPSVQRTVRAVCVDIASGDLPLHVGVDHSALYAQLHSYPGISPRMAEHVTVRLLGDPDRLRADDPEARAGAKVLGLPAKINDLARHGEGWRPWRSHAHAHLVRTSHTSKFHPDTTKAPR
ncbi:hypothetical protein Acsp05_15320 [Actinokineospora sp. NBRC 105648]|nr:hypothetical protein Acsp05_15320 [Actinokineospora sp. NBRC 105648]